MLIKHNVNRVLYMYVSIKAECFILCIAGARTCSDYFNGFTQQHFDKVNLFQSLALSSVMMRYFISSKTISYTESSVGYAILFLVTIHFSHLTMLYCNIALQMHFQCFMKLKHKFSLWFSHTRSIKYHTVQLRFTVQFTVNLTLACSTLRCIWWSFLTNCWKLASWPTYVCDAQCFIHENAHK